VSGAHGLKNRSEIGRFSRKSEKPVVSPVFSKSVGEFENFKNSEIKNSKKTRADFKILGQTRIWNFKVTEATKFGEGETKGKPGKKRKQSVPDKGQP
jgi:hypothetical protein